MSKQEQEVPNGRKTNQVHIIPGELEDVTPRHHGGEFVHLLNCSPTSLPTSEWEDNTELGVHEPCDGIGIRRSLLLTHTAYSLESDKKSMAGAA